MRVGRRGAPRTDAPVVVFLHEGLGSLSMWRDSPRTFCTRRATTSRASSRVAPHLFVEEVSIASIAKARVAYERGELRGRLARHHADPDSAFYGWNDVWLAPEFRAWNIEHEIATIACPVLAVQGEDDEFGTLEQVRAVARNMPQTELVVLTACGHSPHRDQSEALLSESVRFIPSRS